MTKNGLVDLHFYREKEKADKFSEVCKRLGLSMSAIVNLTVDDWMKSQEVFEEAKLSVIKSKALRGVDKK